MLLVPQDLSLCDNGISILPMSLIISELHSPRIIRRNYKMISTRCQNLQPDMLMMKISKECSKRGREQVTLCWLSSRSPKLARQTKQARRKVYGVHLTLFRGLCTVNMQKQEMAYYLEKGSAVSKISIQLSLSLFYWLVCVPGAYTASSCINFILLRSLS